MPLILEGIVTTLNADGTLNVAPMGPIVDPSLRTLHLRPFTTSHTYANLERTRCGVFHVVDDVLLLARAAIDRWELPPETLPAERVAGRVLSAACRWYEFEIEQLLTTGSRADLTAKVVHSGRLRDFFGFNRAKHAVLEAAILATRVHILAPGDLRRQMTELRVQVDKTAGTQEREAFELLSRYINEHISAK
jgi:hypothetical protein